MAEKKLTLAALQAKIHAPKKNKNTFGKYNYRSAEDIYEAVKPVLDEFGVDLVLTDEVRYTEGRFYVVATAKLYIGEKEFSAQGWAREQDTKTGMDPAQLTGACSSYARKYALCALFMIDGSDDFDDLDNRNEGATTEKPKAPAKTQTSQAAKPKAESAPQAAPIAPSGDNSKAFFDAMKALAKKNYEMYLDLLGKEGFESAYDIPEEKRTHVYSVLYHAINKEA
jgi:hypothetical protein